MLPVRPGPLDVFPAVYTATGACTRITKHSQPAFAKCPAKTGNDCYIGHPEVARVSLQDYTNGNCSKISDIARHLCCRAFNCTANVEKYELTVCAANLRNWDLAVEGSPMSSTWMSPRRAVPSGITCVHAHGKSWMHTAKVGCTRQRLDAHGKGCVHTAKAGCTQPRLDAHGKVGCTQQRLDAHSKGWMHTARLDAHSKVDAHSKGWMHTARLVVLIDGVQDCCSHMKTSCQGRPHAMHAEHA